VTYGNTSTQIDVADAVESEVGWRDLMCVTVEISAELLGQSGDDALRATQEAEPVFWEMSLHHLSGEGGAIATSNASVGVRTQRPPYRFLVTTTSRFAIPAWRWAP